MIRKEKETEEEKKRAIWLAKELEVEEQAELEEKKEREEELLKQRAAALEAWAPRTELGRKVKEGKIKDIDEILEQNLPILEPEIVDFLLPLEAELIAIGQAKGKFGGGKRRPWRTTQKKTAEGNIPSFSCMAVVGDRAGHLGVGLGKAKETIPAREKAIRRAKLGLFKVIRGCGSFECICNEPHSIPCKVEGRCSSVRIKLMPAPKGTGLVADDELKKVFRLAGIKDIYTKSFGQTRTKINMVKACISALQQLNKILR